MQAQIYLTLLPAKVLDLVFHHLDFNDKLQLAQTDPLLSLAFAAHIRNDFAYLDTRKVSSKCWPVILPLSGYLVRQINGTWDSQNSIPFHLIGSQCPFLESIKFNVNSGNCMEITSLLLNVKGLKSVHLHISEDCDHSVNIIYALMLLPNLTKLLLHGFDSEVVPKLRNLIYLEDLSLNLLSCLQPVNIFAILSSLHNLRTLHISNMNIMEDRHSCCNELQDLEIVGCNTYSFLPRFPKLNSLRFRRNSNYSPDFHILNWISLHANTLEFLELPLPDLQSTRFNSREEALLGILENFENLRTLHLVDSVTWHFGWSFKDMLRDKCFSPKRPFQLVLKNFENVKSMFPGPRYWRLVYMRSPRPWERCAWGCL